jgi:phosphoglycerate dehydrogenase-like enzyme
MFLPFLALERIELFNAYKGRRSDLLQLDRRRRKWHRILQRRRRAAAPELKSDGVIGVGDIGSRIGVAGLKLQQC